MIYLSEDKITADRHYTLYLYRSIASVVAMENLSINIGLREDLTNVVTLLSLKPEFTHQTSEDTGSCSSTSPGGPQSRMYLCSRMCYLQQSLCLHSGLFGDMCKDSPVKCCVPNQRPILSRREHHALLLPLVAGWEPGTSAKPVYSLFCCTCVLYTADFHTYILNYYFIFILLAMCVHMCTCRAGSELILCHLWRSKGLGERQFSPSVVLICVLNEIQLALHGGKCFHLLIH